MDKLRMTKGRLGVAVVFMALFAMFAMPAFASAATFTSQYPTATLVAAPAVVAVDVIGAPALKATTADITINGVSYPTFVKQAGASAGAWTSVVSGTPDAYGQYRSTWTWVGGANANATVYCYPPSAANANGAKAVVMSVKDSTGAAITTSWSYTVATPAVIVPPVPVNASAAFNANCTGCHGAAPHGTAFPYNTAGIGFGANCSSCHYDGFPAHGYVTGDPAKHTVLATNIAASDSKTCAACHGTNVLNVATRNTKGTVSTADDSFVVPAVAPGGNMVAEHKGCSCHDYGEVAPGKVCGSCHDGAYGAIHGWKVAESGYSAGKWNVSGHNTSNFGTVGARTDFSSLGITDTAGNAPSAQFPQTVNNTFKAGWDWNSVVECEDCHTGLTANEPAGPHGAFDFSATAGIDPAYPGEFATASLWGGQYDQKVASGATLTIGPFAEGIAQWTPAGGESEELKDYQVYTPDMSTAASTKLVAGPATVTAGNVICVKCHDLYDSTKSTGFKGWGNYPHEHHSADTGSFKMYFGKFEVGDGGVSVTSQTVAAESAAAAMAMVPGANKNKQITAPGLGREVAGACRNCHIAIPHGWKRPKLIVYSNMAEPSVGWRASLGLPAAGDSAPYNIGPAVFEGEGLNGTNIGSGQMNGLASGPVHFQEATHLLDGSTLATPGTDPAQLLIEHFDYPALYETTPANGSEFVNWSSAQCNACGHHSTTSFANPAAVQPPMTWSTRELNFSSTKPANGAWK